MKKTLILTLIILLFPIIAFAQNGLVNPNQVAPVTISVEAGEDLSAGDVVSLINSGGTMKAYNNPTTVSTSPNGAESVFNSATTSYCSAVALDSTRFLVAYKDSDVKPYAKVGTVSGSSISWGTESAAFENVNSSYITACKIATDKVLVCYNSATTVGRMVVLSISGSTITVNTPAEFSSYVAYYNSLTFLDTDKALVCYQEQGNIEHGAAKVISVSGTTPSAGTIAYFNAAVTSHISVSALSSTSAIVAYQDGGNSSYGTAQVLSISGTTITPGTEYVFESATTTYTSVAALSSTAAVITYEAGGGKTLVATNAAGELSYGTAATFTDGQYNSTAKIDSTHVIIASQVAATNTGQSIIGIISGTGITLETAYTYNAAESTYNSVCYLGSNKSAIAYTDVGNSSYGTSVVNAQFASTYASVAGLSSGAYSSGSDAVVLIHGTYDGLSSLIPGSPYFVNASFELSTTSVSLTNTIASNSSTTREIYFGTAKSSTEIILNIDYR